jgi:hypothetical protein
VAVRRHAPIWHASPEQHSLLSLQPRPSAWHAQRPPLQSMYPQQSRLLVQPWLTPTQQRCDEMS